MPATSPSMQYLLEIQLIKNYTFFTLAFNFFKIFLTFFALSHSTGHVQLNCSSSINNVGFSPQGCDKENRPV